MLPTDICRTCARQTDNLLALSTCIEKYLNKRISDMLHELTHNDPMELASDDLPQNLCEDCLHQLQNAYGFVLQARQVQEQLLLKLRKELLSPKCLDETPIEMAVQPIKTESDIEFGAETENADQMDPEDDCAVSSLVCVAALKLQPESDSESNRDDADREDLQPMQLRRSVRNAKPSNSSEDEAESGSTNQTLIKRRRGRPARVTKDQTTNEEGRFTCEVCKKTFSWHRDMQRHARIHYGKPSHVCEHCGRSFLRKDKYIFHMRTHEKNKSHAPTLNLEWRFAERLYSSGLLKSVECKLCGLRFQRILELREHIASHARPETLSDLSAESEVIREQFPNHQDMTQIRQLVCADIAKGREYLDKYCSVVNIHGYELCLSDSDEEIVGVTPPYKCLPCNASFTRKYHLMRHTLESHIQSINEADWQRCNKCQIGFVCVKLLEQHQRTQCYSQVKRYSCTECPGKFVWQQNLKLHDCCKVNRIAADEDRRQFYCCLCDEQLESMSSLRSHLLTHRDGRTGIDQKQSSTFFRYFYPNGLDCNWTELSGRITNDFEIGDYGRYFNACTAAGQELDFLASDTDLSDNEATSSVVLTCDLCGGATTRLTYLRRHQASQHSELKSMPHVCATCGRGFVARSLLQWHLRTACCKQHVNYKCTDCNLYFVWQSNHERHMKLVHKKVIDDETAEELKEVPRLKTKRQQSMAKLQCGECEKLFIWPKDLTRHKRIHQLQTAAQYDCSFCPRKFYRKDGLKSHMRVHGEQLQLETTSKSISNPDTAVLQNMPVVLSQLCRPNGCKQIKCMICASYHTKIADLRTHIISHRFALPPLQHANPEEIETTCRTLYPELDCSDMDREQLIQRIQFDLAKGDELERFVSITNEAGIELSLDSSETETDSDSTESTERNSRTASRTYDCDLCQLKVSRKHKLYAHQLEQHAWQEASRVCSHCQARFVNKHLLEHHYRTLCRNGLKRFLCRKCPLRFRWRNNLKLHADIAHPEVVTEKQPNTGIQLTGTSLLPVGSYECHECKRSFKMQKDLTRHKLMHAQESSIYRCRWCARRFYREANLLQHIERHGINAAQLPYAETLLNASRHPNGLKCIQCKVCNVQFPTIATLRSHLMTAPSGTHHDAESMLNYSITNQFGYELHLEDSETDDEVKPPGTPPHYTCGMCQLRCKRKYEMHQHQQAMHRLERISDGCDQCIFKSVSADLIAYHKRVQCSNSEKQFKCSKCGYKFMWESNLSLHMHREHSNCDIQAKAETVAGSVESTSSQTFKCGQCPRKYNRKDRLTAHVKKCHAPNAIASKKTTKTTSSVAKQQKSFLCAFCGKAVSSSSNLIVHIRRHTGEKPFKCDFCDMAFPRSSDLQCHRRTHTGERPHVCTVCQRGFSRSYKLQQHMRIHNGERPYKCTYCDKSFTQSNDLTLHIRRHTGERPYQCSTCGERFIQGTALKNHRQQSGHKDDTEDQPKTN